MERRDFLRLGAAGASMGLAACARPAEAPPPPTASIGVEEFLRRVDEGKRAIAASTPLRDAVAQMGRDPTRVPPHVVTRDEALFRKALGALFLSASFRDLTREEQLDPRVQDVMWRSLPEMNEGVVGIADHMEKLSDVQRRAIGHKLRDDPDLAVGLFETLDNHSAKVGIASQRRLQLRNIAHQAGWRLRTQPLALFIDEHVEKVQKVARRENEALLASIATAPPAEGAEAPSSAAGTVAKVGAILLGLSLLTGTIGIALVSSSGGAGVVGAILITAGVLGTVGGLITLLVAAIMAAAE